MTKSQRVLICGEDLDSRRNWSENDATPVAEVVSKDVGESLRQQFCGNLN